MANYRRVDNSRCSSSSATQPKKVDACVTARTKANNRHDRKFPRFEIRKYLLDLSHDSKVRLFLDAEMSSVLAQIQRVRIGLVEATTKIRLGFKRKNLDPVK